MGSNDIPPPHVPSHVVPISNLLLQIGASLWTICYFLLVRESFKSKSYGMPLFAVAVNFAWELVYTLYVTEPLLERLTFTFWIVLDGCMVWGMMKYAKNEWKHAPVVANNIVSIFTGMTIAATVGHWTFAQWWIDNDMGKREGKFYRGVVGPDTTELAFWSAIVCQINLSASSLCQLVVRQHSGGVSWSIWATRMLGSVIGFYMVYAWNWYFWREAHEYFVSPLGLFFWVTSLLCDCIYPFVLWEAQKTEKVLDDGRKVGAHMMQANTRVKND